MSRARAARVGSAGVFLAVALTALGPAVIAAEDFGHVPVRGMVTLLDLGSDQCVPCKLMAPILKKVEQDYKDRAAVVVIDVYRYPEQAKRFGIRAIPTQIFFDKDGKEVFRHMGFMSEKAIVEQLAKMGVK